VERLSAEGRGLIARRLALGREAGGANAENYRLWAIEEYGKLEAEGLARLDALGKQVEAANTAFVESIKTFTDALLKGAKTITDTLPPDDDDDTPDDERPGPYYQASLALQTDANGLLSGILDAIVSQPPITVIVNQNTDGGFDVVDGRTTGM
jgi:hypothetical protein